MISERNEKNVPFYKKVYVFFKSLYVCMPREKSLLLLSFILSTVDSTKHNILLNTE